MPNALNVLVFAGSPRPVSYTRSLTRRIARALEERGARVHLLDLYETPLPPLDPVLRAGRPEHPDPHVADLYRRAVEAEAYVLASPTYHNSYAGVLKNALDWLALRDFRYRLVGLAAHGGRATHAVDHLRIVVRGVLGVAIPTQVCTREADYRPGPDDKGLYEVTDEDILGRIDRMADELLLFGKHLRALRGDMAAQRS